VFVSLYPQALVVVIVFIGALLRHAIQSFVLPFFLTFSHNRLEVATDVVLKSFQNLDYSNSSLKTVFHISIIKYNLSKQLASNVAI